MSSTDFSKMTSDQKKQYLDNLRALDGVPPAARAMIANEAINSQKKVNPQLYWSEVMFQATKTGSSPGPYTIGVTAADRKAFVYKQGDDMTAAGFPTPSSATFANTNLQSGGSQTNDNADVVIWGIALEFPDGGPGGDGEIEILKALSEVCWLELQLNSNTTFKIGKLSDFPCAGGFYGQQPSKLRAGNLGNELGAVEGSVTNGNPMASNYFKLPTPYRWNSVGSNKADTALAITFKMSGPVSITSSADRTAATGVAAFTVPDATGIAQRVRVKLATIEIGGRSVNS